MREFFDDTECAFNRGPKFCSALECKNCSGCRFKKTKEQLEESRARAFNRLSQHPNKYAIMSAYYGKVLTSPPGEKYINTGV